MAEPVEEKPSLEKEEKEAQVFVVDLASDDCQQRLTELVYFYIEEGYLFDHQAVGILESLKFDILMNGYDFED